MTTDFFERQADARRSTAWLISMFSLAVLGICLTVFVVATLAVTRANPYTLALIQEDPSVLGIPALATLAALVLIIGGTLYKVVELRGGGGTLVAERLGGRRIFPNTSHTMEKRLLNVVEEMALASGTPVPPVFLLDEDGINAFAAGYSASDAVIGVTRGCAALLNRDELQGVIAHEFSHILNGDMRMSIRLIGVLHGILLLGLTGQTIFRLLYYTGHGRSRSRDKNSGQIMLVVFLLAVVLIALGFLGTFFGNLIKAAVSRQREFLADASAVQFTRNPQGLASALKKIGAFASGSRLTAPAAAEASHLFFAKGVFEGFTGLWATHPKLEARIRAIDPNWDGHFPRVDQAAHPGSDQRPAHPHQHVSNFANTGAEVPLAAVDAAIDQLGEPAATHREYAAELVAALPDLVVEAVHEPYGARAVIYALLLDRHDREARQHQWQALQQLSTDDVISLTRNLAPVLESLDVRGRLPLIDMALPALRSMSPGQYKEFGQCFDRLVKADRKINLFEWVLSQILIRHLRQQFEPVRSPRVRYYGLQRLSMDCSVLLSAIAYSGLHESESPQQAKAAFARAEQLLPEVALSLRPQSECGLGNLTPGLSTLSTVSAKHRGRLVDACAAVICADGQVRWQEAELLRGVADLLDCPMPPVIA